MIDTVKIFSMISYDIYKIIESKSNIKTSYNNATGEIFYNIINDNLSGSYNSSLSVRTDKGSKYNFIYYYIEIERLLS